MHLDLLQTVDATQPDDLLQITQVFGDPKPDICAATQQSGLRVTLDQSGQKGLAARSCEKHLFGTGKHIGVIIEGGKHLCAGLHGRAKTVMHRSLTGTQGRLDNRPITCTAAQITRQRLRDRTAIQHLATMAQGKKAHHNSGGTEPALRGMVFNHRRLHRMQAVALSQILDCDHLGPIDLPQQHDTSIDRVIDHLPAP